jgi:hypothetical protein
MLKVCTFCFPKQAEALARSPTLALHLSWGSDGGTNLFHTWRLKAQVKAVAQNGQESESLLVSVSLTEGCRIWRAVHQGRVQAGVLDLMSGR